MENEESKLRKVGNFFKKGALKVAVGLTGPVGQTVAHLGVGLGGALTGMTVGKMTGRAVDTLYGTMIGEGMGSFIGTISGAIVGNLLAEKAEDKVTDLNIKAHHELFMMRNEETKDLFS